MKRVRKQAKTIHIDTGAGGNTPLIARKLAERFLDREGGI